MKSELIWRIFLAGCCSLLLASCAPGKTIQTLGKMKTIIMTPDTPIGPPKDQPSTATVIVYAEADANKNEYGPAPVNVLIFELITPDQLTTADMLSLLDDPKATLGTSYIKHLAVQVKPGESTVFPLILDKSTAYIGAVAGFANTENIRWNAVERVNATGENYNILVPVARGSISIQVHR
jgi:type VI secretion system protein VasD